jgi:hypothetical protein
MKVTINNNIMNEQFTAFILRRLTNGNEELPPNIVADLLANKPPEFLAQFIPEETLISILTEIVIQNYPGQINRPQHFIAPPPREPVRIRPAPQPVRNIPAPPREPARMKPFDLILKVKEKVIAKVELEKNTEDCPICNEPHLKKDSVVTPCGHLFGKECLQNWHSKTCVQIKLFSKPFSKCPMCREPVNNVNGFRERCKKSNKP